MGFFVISNMTQLFWPPNIINKLNPHKAIHFCEEEILHFHLVEISFAYVSKKKYEKSRKVIKYCFFHITIGSDVQNWTESLKILRHLDLLCHLPGPFLGLPRASFSLFGPFFLGSSKR